MKRDGAREVSTPFGTFYGGVFEANGKHGPTFYAETETGEVTVNGVTYRGTVYAERFSHDGQLYVSVRHLTRWDDKRGHYYPASESAQKKLGEALLPTFRAWSEDGGYITARKVSSLRSSWQYAVGDANRAIGKANELAEKMHELGAECPVLSRFDLAGVDA